jgi:G protein-coupled receptor kinase interacting protein 2
MMMVRFRANGYSDLADRLVELQYELTDRLTCFIGGKRVDHKTGQHILLPDLHEK